MNRLERLEFFPLTHILHLIIHYASSTSLFFSMFQKIDSIYISKILVCIMLIFSSILLFRKTFLFWNHMDLSLIKSLSQNKNLYQNGQLEKCQKCQKNVQNLFFFCVFTRIPKAVLVNILIFATETESNLPKKDFLWKITKQIAVIVVQGQNWDFKDFWIQPLVLQNIFRECRNFFLLKCWWFKEERVS